MWPLLYVHVTGSKRPLLAPHYSKGILPVGAPQVLDNLLQNNIFEPPVPHIRKAGRKISGANASTSFNLSDKCIKSTQIGTLGQSASHISECLLSLRR